LRVVVIGATGHIGTYLVPRLVAAGHDVVALSRNERAPYRYHPAFDAVELISVDRNAEDTAGTFAKRVRELRADVVVDLICFSTSSAAQLSEALRGSPTFLAHCGTLWVHGPAVTVPILESAPRRPLEPYGAAKAEIERLLLGEHRQGNLRVCVLHPGHIVGPGWRPVNPAGNLSLEVFSRLARGEELCLPHVGLETLHHVHADDVAQAFMLALEQPNVSAGEAFHVVSSHALTFRGYAEAVGSWFGRSAKLVYLPFDAWREGVAEEDAQMTWTHLSHSPSASIEKAQHLLGYAPRYSSLEAVHEALAWLMAHGELDVGSASLAPLPTIALQR
jgi:nucleoside-diphosphate-sugar epimerase